MSIQYPTDEFEDRISLKLYVDTLLNRKLLILGVMAGAIFIASIFGFLIRNDAYTSSAIIAVPGHWGIDPASGTQIKTLHGWSQQAYKEFALSNTVLDEVSNQTGTPTKDLRGSYTINMDTGGSLLMISATSDTNERALRLTNEWIDAYHKMALLTLRAETIKIMDHKTSELETLTQAFTAAQTSLNDFEKDAQISLDETNLAALEPELVRRRMRIQELELITPVYKKDIAFTELLLESEPKTLGTTSGVSSIIDMRPSDVLSVGEVTILNPVFLTMSERLTEVRANLINAETELETLGPSISQLEQEIQKLANGIIDKKSTQQILWLTLEIKQSAYEIGISAYELLLTQNMLIQELSNAKVISDTIVEAPRILRKNITLIGFAGLLGLILGIVAAFTIQRYKNESDLSNKIEGSTNYKQTQNDG